MSSNLIADIREAFDGDSVEKKNLALGRSAGQLKDLAPLANYYGSPNHQVHFFGKTRCAPEIEVWGLTDEYLESRINLVTRNNGVATCYELRANNARQLAEMILAAIRSGGAK